MVFRSFVLLFALLAPTVVVQASTARDFIVVVHYEKNASTACLDDPTQSPQEPVSVRMMVAGEENIVVGAGINPDTTCAIEASCILNPESSICAKLNRTAPIPVFWDIDAGGLVVECDESDQEIGLDACRHKSGCEKSSVYPSCLFQPYTIKDVIENPTVIQRSNPNGVDPYSYLLLYSDSECKTLEGLRSFTEGPQDVVMAAPATPDVACDTSVACLTNPNGPKCQAIGKTVIQTIFTDVQEDGQTVFSCVGNSTKECTTPASTMCTASIVPGCYQRWPSARVLQTNPSAFIGAGAGLQTGPAPMSSTTSLWLAPAATMILRSFVTVGLGLLLLVVAV